MAQVISSLEDMFGSARPKLEIAGQSAGALTAGLSAASPYHRDDRTVEDQAADSSKVVGGRSVSRIKVLKLGGRPGVDNGLIDTTRLSLARYGLFDESAMPSAWVAPFPPSSRSQPCALYDSSTASGRADTSTLPRSAYRGSQPSATTSVPSSQLPLLVQMSLQPDAGSSDQRSIPYGGGGGGAASATDQPISPLAYSLSAELASVGKHRFRLTYVTDRLLAGIFEALCQSYFIVIFSSDLSPPNPPPPLNRRNVYTVVSYPPDAQESDHNEGARWLCRAFERRYGQNYRIFNLSGFTKELHLSSQAPVIDLFWPAPLAPGLEQLVTAIDQLDYWLHNHDNGAVQYGLGMDEISVQPPGKIAVLHCTGPRSLLATYLAVYICQSKARFGPLCGQRPGSPTARGLQWTENRFRRFRNELVLGHMILKRFYEDNLARELSPSQKRYVGYFSGLVTGALILQDRLVYLHAVVYRNPSRGRFFTPSLEPITENNGNSIYAHPDELWRGTRYTQPSSSSSGLQAMQRGYWGSEQQREHPNVWDWGRLASIELSDSKPEDAASHFDGTFPTDQENLCRLTRKIESEMRPQRGAESSQVDYPQAIEPVRGFMDGEGGMLLKIYQNLKLMHTTKMLSPTSNFYVEKYIFPIEPVLPLHGDILIACFLKPDLSTCVQEIIFRLQFHTCATSTEKLSFYKHDLDEACSDNRFPPTGCVELYFSPNPELLREHKDNIDRGGYTWTSTDRESSILTVGLSDRRIDYLNLPADKQQLRYAAATAAGPSYVADQTRIATRSPPQPEEPLSILITTQEYIITTPTALYSTDSKPSEAPMWSEGGGPGQPGEFINFSSRDHITFVFNTQP
ncbi:unnamed protein product [Calicophoron daubneyi]|uniref:C2 tensin-type domain-containing protein n=1 Tax=Calicophoron daubneyi TaxID=300641 RepID=A0AAV2SY96_CALDB